MRVNMARCRSEYIVSPRTALVAVSTIADRKLSRCPIAEATTRSAHCIAGTNSREIVCEDRLISWRHLDW